MRILFLWAVFGLFAVLGIIGHFWPPVWYSMILFGPFVLLGMADVIQRRQTIRRNFPVLGHGRYLMEAVRPEINQYFVESNLDGRPFNREERSVIYQRAKGQLDTLAFGTQKNLYDTGSEWINHSLNAVVPTTSDPRVLVGGPDCKKPYSASIFNISGMSYGALSKNAVEALNKGAAKGGFCHNTGEGSISPYHLKHGGDLVWQIGTGYFGCRTDDGGFSEEKFKDRAELDQVKMIEIKLSQGAKPGHGGILPKEKVTKEISQIRSVPMGKDVISPPTHAEFSTPKGLLEFVQKLRNLSGGKPVGFKICIGRKSEFFSILKTMKETGITPDFITVDGAEGGTGAAPLEFADSIGSPLMDGLVFVHNALLGMGLRDKITLQASGKVTTGFHIASRLALGADICVSARGFMFALGCIQALRCNSNHCPAGVATSNPELNAGLSVANKFGRVANYHHHTVHSFLEVIASAGLTEPGQLRPWHIQRRIGPLNIRNYGDLYHFVEEGDFLKEKIPEQYQWAWSRSSTEWFAPPSD